MGTLYLVATPIGNLEDITHRAVRILGQVDLIAAEDTRQTRKLLARYQLSTPLISYHEHNKHTRLPQLLEALQTGSIALVSDAGTPGLSDPGLELVQAAYQAQHQVSPIPGPSAPIAALVISGLPTDSFVYLGYLPRRKAERRRALEEIAPIQRTLVLFETPHRLKQTLVDMETILGTERLIVVCRELTKQHEEVLRGTLEMIREHYVHVEPRGEFTLVVAGANRDQRWTVEEVRSALQQYQAQGLSPSQAAREIAAKAGWPRSAIYRLTLEDK